MTNEHLPGGGPPAIPPVRSRSDPGRRLLALAIVALLGMGVYQLFGSSFKAAPNRPGWSMFESKRDGVSVQFPDSWHAARIFDTHRGSPYTAQVRAVAISNVDRLFKRAACGENCWSPWVNAVGLPSNGVMIQVGWSYSGGFSCTATRDTPLPISLAKAQRTMSRDGAGGTPQMKLVTFFTAGLKPGFSLSAWVGSKASKADLDTLEKIVASISYKAVNPGPPDKNAC